MLMSEDFFYISQYEASVSDGNRWLTVCGKKGEAIQAGSNYIRDILLRTRLTEQKNKGTITAIEEACKARNYERAIELWNRSFPDNKVKVYKAASTI
jgi:hypothetical protein